MNNPQEIVKKLELSLLSQSIRHSRHKISEIIADDFMEFGSSGMIYNKDEILDLLLNEEDRNFEILDFHIIELSKEVMLVTYKSLEIGSITLRSSIWKFNKKNWQMAFHQGTKTS